MDWRQEAKQLKPTTTRTTNRDGNDHSKYLRLTTSLKHLTTNNNFSFNNRKHQQQSPSFALFLIIIILVTLSPFRLDSEPSSTDVEPASGQSSELTELKTLSSPLAGELRGGTQHMGYLDICIMFLQPILMNPVRFSSRKFNQAEAKVLGKMAKMWYIKKKLKKLGKKLKKHTIAVPVFTAIPIYEHPPYFPQPHIAHIPAPLPMHHHHMAAASSYSPVAVSHLAAVAAAAAQQQQQQPQPHHHQTNQQHVASASNQQQQQVAAYRVPPAQVQHHHQQHHTQPSIQPSTQAHHLHHAIFQPIPAANQIINTYIPSAPIYVDEIGGLYGHYGNAYGRYDGGYQLW